MGTVLVGLLGPIVGGIAVAFTTYWTTRPKARAEARKLEAEADRTRAETTKILAEIDVRRPSVAPQDTTPKGWGVSGSVPEDYEVGLDFEVFCIGRASAFIRSRHENPTGYASLVQTIRADEYRGTRLQLTAMVKARDVLGWAGIWMRVDDARDHAVAFDNMREPERRIAGSVGWRTYSIVLDVPENGAYINFGAVMERTGQIWLDDVRLSVVDNSVPTVDTFSNLPRHPVNLDFENGTY
ncbi:hypothetical protein [Streptomyces sp. NBC_01565]|uniref:hypothetical protein n=1 Tax=unclassified Streptomyces TaxID=2593676 RepID=UPI002250198A|nr:hypothetical protein [Streptomyces sp. NBC_01565]MCX4546286.1 hypothetical protein [Streptomyces sp. NBC_01565]